jgi:hypothetical protein
MPDTEDSPAAAGGSAEVNSSEKRGRPVQADHFLQWLGRISLQVGKVSLQVGLSLIFIALLLLVIASFLFRRSVQQAIGSYPLDSTGLEVGKVNHYSESRLNEIGQKYSDPMVENLLIDVHPPNRIDVSAKWAGLFQVELPLTVELIDQRPHVQVTEINGIPFFLVTDNISRGINDGIDVALRDASVKVTSLEIEDAAVSFRVETGTDDTSPAGSQLSITSPSSNKVVVLAISNQIGENIILEIDGDQWTIPANDSEIIEISAGTYDYALRSSAGEVIARGQQSWTQAVHHLFLGLNLDQRIELSEKQSGQ